MPRFALNVNVLAESVLPLKVMAAGTGAPGSAPKLASLEARNTPAEMVVLPE